MSTAKNIIRDLLKTAKEKFNALVTPAAAAAPGATEPAPAAPAAPAASAPKVYMLQDGTEISIEQAGDTVAPGDKVMINGVAAAEGELCLEDGTCLELDAAGVITEVKAPQPVTTTDAVPAQAQAPVQPAQQTQPMQAAAATPAATDKLPSTAEEMRKLYDAFATGTPEERIANLEIIAKALMEYSFGWEIKQAKEKAARDQAILLYEEQLKTAQATQMRQQEVITSLFAVVEKMAEIPESDPRTLSGNRKDQFEKMETKEARLRKFSEGIKKLKQAQA